MSGLLASPWIPTIAMLLLACGARLLSRSWLAPGPFALLIWTVYLVSPLALAPEYPVPALGPWIILALILSIALGAYLGAGEITAIDHAAPLEPLRCKRMLRLSLYQTLLACIGVVYWAGNALSENGLDLSVSGMLMLGHILSVERYAGGEPPLLARVLVIWLFPAALLCGMAFRALQTRKERLLCFLVLIPTVFLSLMQATRANTLIVVALGLCGYVAMRAGSNRDVRLGLTRKGSLTALAALSVAVSFFFVVDALRTHDQEHDLRMDADWNRAKTSSLGYLAVFSHWANLPDGPGSFHLGLGAYTFGGMLDAAGLHHREVGVYAESTPLEGDESNIYTAFRGFIEDFSFPGAVVLCLVIGLFSGVAYKNTLLGRMTWAAALAGFYAFLAWSPIISLFVYNGAVLAVLVGILTLKSSTNRASTARSAMTNAHLR